MTIAAVYLRVSKSDETDDESLTLATQRRRIAALCEARGWTYGPEYIDDGISATKARGSGTEWARMISEVRTGRFDVIVARDLDRLLRTLQDLVKLIDLGAKVATVDGEIDLTTADGEFRATMLAAVARFEIRRKSERAIGANETRRRRGVPIMRGRILGYDEDCVTQIDDEAEAVKKAYEDFLAGVKITHIARDLTEQGFTTTKGRPWSNANIRSLLKNSRYKGVITKWETDEEKRAEGKRYADEEYNGDFEAIVSKDVWEAVQIKLKDPARRRPWSNSPQYLLSGIALCGKCGDGTKLYKNAYHRTPYTGKDGTRREFEPKRIYSCTTKKHLSRTAVPVDKFIEEQVFWRLAQPDAVDLFSVAKGEEVDAKGLRIERISVQDRFDGLAELVADGLLPVQKAREQSARLRARLNEIDGLLAPQPSNPGLELVRSENIPATWASYDIERQRLIVKQLMKITVLPSQRGAKGFDTRLIQVDWRRKILITS